MTGRRARPVLSAVWRQVPFFLWLIALWMLLWGQFTPVSLLTGLIVALVVTRVFRLPPVELSGRVSFGHGIVFIVTFLGALVRGSLLVAWQAIRPAGPPTSAVIGVPLRTDDDFIMTNVAVTASLIPGSLIVDIDRDRRILYLHVLGVQSAADLERQRRAVAGWETRIVRAVGSRAQVELVRGRRDAPGPGEGVAR